MSEFLAHRTSFIVWHPENGQTREDGRKVPAFSAESAAVKWAERDDADSADYLIVRGNDATVMVAEDRDGSEPERFVVSGESCPVYRARKAP